MALPTEYFIKRPLLPEYELFPASNMPFTDCISCQKGFFTPYEFFYTSYMPFASPILYHTSFDTP